MCIIIALHKMHHSNLNRYLHSKSTFSSSLSSDRKLHTAIEGGDLAEVEQLLKNGASVNCLIDGLTPTARAIIAKQHEIALHLITKYPADVHQGQRTFNVHPHLHLPRGILPGERNSNHVPLLLLAVSHRFLDVVKELLRRGADINSTGNSRLDTFFFYPEGSSFFTHKANVSLSELPRNLNLFNDLLIIFAQIVGQIIYFHLFTHSPD